MSPTPSVSAGLRLVIALFFAVVVGPMVGLMARFLDLPAPAPLLTAVGGGLGAAAFVFVFFPVASGRIRFFR